MVRADRGHWVEAKAPALQACGREGRQGRRLGRMPATPPLTSTLHRDQKRRARHTGSHVPHVCTHAHAHSPPMGHICTRSIHTMFSGKCAHAYTHTSAHTCTHVPALRHLHIHAWGIPSNPPPHTPLTRACLPFPCGHMYQICTQSYSCTWKRASTHMPFLTYRLKACSFLHFLLLTYVHFKSLLYAHILSYRHIHSCTPTVTHLHTD